MQNNDQKLTFKLSSEDGPLSKAIEQIIKKEAQNKKAKPANPTKDK